MSVVYPNLPTDSLPSAEVALSPPKSVVKKPQVPRHQESPFEQFYRTYCTELREADVKREAYKKEHPEWKSVFDDEFPHPEKGLLAMSTGDPNGHVRVRRLRDFASFIVLEVKDNNDKIFITQALIAEINAALEEEDNEFPLPQPVVAEVIAYAQGQGNLTDKYYEYENGEWVTIVGQPDFKQDRREHAEDTPYVGDDTPAISEIPTFVQSIYKAERATELFKGMLENPTDKGIADTYESEVNGEVVRKAKELNFGGEVKLPVSHFRGTVMASANMHSLKEGMEAKARQGEDVRMGEIDLESIRSMYSSTLSGGKSLLEGLGCPPSWTNLLDAAVVSLSENHRKTKQGSIFTDKELADVHGQHGGSFNESSYTDLSKKMRNAEDVFTNTTGDQKLPEGLSAEDERAFSAARKQPPAKRNAATKSGPTLQSPGIKKLAGGKRPSPNSLPTSATKRPVGPSSEAGPVQTNEGHGPVVDATSSEDVDMGGTGPDSGTATLEQNGLSSSDGRTDTHMGQGEDIDVGGHQGTGVKAVLPLDMTWYRSTWNDATPLMERILSKPREALGEPGDKLASMNKEIASRTASDQEQLSLGENPATINVDLEIPVVDFMRVMILCTDSLVASGKSKATEIEDSSAKIAWESLVSRLKLAGQPWHDEVDKLIECKANAWKAHIAAGTDAEKDELLWDDEFKKIVLESDQKHAQLGKTDVFASPENQSGKIGGFRVASKKRDGTETYQVLVQKGNYPSKDAQTTLWHIRPASMYRAELVGEYKKNQGIEITTPDTSSDQGKQKVQSLRQYKVADIKISGIAVIPRTQGEGFTKMPTMFIQASVEDGVGARFWSRSYMNKVWGPAATRVIRDRINVARIPVLTNDPTKPNLFMPEKASKRTCTLWGVEYTGPKNANDRGEDITGEDDGELEPNDGIYESDDGFVVPDTEKAIDPRSKEFVKADKLRKIEELKVQIAALEGPPDDDE